MQGVPGGGGRFGLRKTDTQRGEAEQKGLVLDHLQTPTAVGVVTLRNRAKNDPREEDGYHPLV